MKSRLRFAWRVLKWTGICLLLYYLTLGEGWKDLTLGRFHRKAHTLFSDTSGVTEARIFLLMGREDQQTKETFPIRPYGRQDPICGEARLKGDQLRGFLDQWERQSPSYWKQALCHEPAYGFRLYRGSSLVAETSVCWHCSNYYVDMWPIGASWYGFDAESKSAKELLAICDKLLPYRRPPEPKKTAEGK